MARLMLLRACLDQCSLSLLRQIAEAHALPVPEAPARAELLGAIADVLLVGGYLERLVAGLSEPEKLALAVAASENGEARSFLLERELRQAAGAGIADARQTIAGLLRRGLLYRAFQATGPDRGEVYILPDELRPLVPQFVQPSFSALEAAPLPPLSRTCQPLFELFTLASFVRRWRREALRAPKRENQLAALSRETAALALELPGRDPRERWTLLAHLGIRLELLRRDENGILLLPELEDWLSQGPSAEAELWQAYLSADQWNDLERASTRGARYAGHCREPLDVRRQIVGEIRELLTGDWVQLDDVLRSVRERRPDFLREGFDATTARLLDLTSGEVLAGPGSWERVEEPVLRYVLAGPLYWLGVLEWGGDGERWDRLRLSDRGRAWLLDAARTPNPVSPRPCEHLPPRGLRATPDCDLGLLWQLEPYVELAQRGPPSEYQLTRASFARGLEAGGSASALRDLLEHSFAASLPQAMALAIDRWSTRGGRFQIRPAVLLTAADESELSAVLEHADIAGFVQERLGPRSAAIEPARAVELADALERSGSLAEVDAALQLMAGRRAYSALVDQHTLETLFVALQVIRSLKMDLGKGLPHADRLIRRLELALGDVQAPRLTRQARSLARDLKRPPRQRQDTARESWP